MAGFYTSGFRSILGILNTIPYAYCSRSSRYRPKIGNGCLVETFYTHLPAMTDSPLAQAWHSLARTVPNNVRCTAWQSLAAASSDPGTHSLVMKISHSFAGFAFGVSLLACTARHPTAFFSTPTPSHFSPTPSYSTPHEQSSPLPTPVSSAVSSSNPSART